MPVFGYGPTVDLIIFLMPFFGVWIINSFLKNKIKVAPTGFIIIGILCIITQRIKYRYGIYHEGLIAIVLGIFYIIAGSITLLQEIGKSDDKRK